MGAGRDFLPDEMAGNKFNVGEVTIDFARNVVIGPNGVQRLEPKQAHLLAVLMENVGHVVTRDDLIIQVWNGAAGADQSLTNTISNLRKHFVSVSVEKFKIETIPKKGYRLEAEFIAASARFASDNSYGPSERKNRSSFKVLIISLISIAAFGLVWISWGSLSGNTDVESTELNRFHLNVLTEDPHSEMQNDFSKMLRRKSMYSFSANRIPMYDPSTSISSNNEFRLTVELSESSENLRADANLVHLPSQNIIWSSKSERSTGNIELFAEHLSYYYSNLAQCLIFVRNRFGERDNSKLLNLILQECDIAKNGEEKHTALADITQNYLSIAPDLAESHARYGSALAVKLFVYPFVPEEELQSIRKNAYEHLNHALELDPDNSRALMGLGYIPNPDVGIDERMDYFLNVLENEPKIMMSRIQLGHHLYSVGRVEDAFAYYRLVQKDFPLEEQWAIVYIRQLMPTTYENAARDFARPYLDRFPESRLLNSHWFFAEFWYGDPDIAREYAAKVGFFKPHLACFELVLSSRENQSKPTVDDIYELCTGGPFWIYYYFAYFGYVDEAFKNMEALKEIFEEPSAVLFRRNLFEPVMSQMHNDPRFFEYARDIGLVDYWISTEKWPDFCTKPSLPYDCKILALK